MLQMNRLQLIEALQAMTSEHVHVEMLATQALFLQLHHQITCRDNDYDCNGYVDAYVTDCTSTSILCVPHDVTM